jgi:uncharacterized protein (TIGR00251 family)
VILAVRVIPRSPRSKIDGRRGDAILVRLAAPPVEGAANEALIDLLSREFHLPKRQITIVSGLTSRDKRVELSGVPDADIQARLSDILNRGT